ncbi:phage tail tube protein [Hylemonella sp. W303a]|uniref:phage tail tube protein n=1 Tax=Hylemonella sp. W303a TaxID=3389873 RepID=UPI00396B44B1
MSIFLKQTVILAKLETTKGTDSAPTGAANAMLVSNVSFTPLEGDEVEREVIRPYFGDSGSAMVTQYCKLSFDVEFAGVAVPGSEPGYADLLRACACDVTVTAGTDVTFAPISQDLDSVTLYINIGGNRQKIMAGMANCKIDAPAKSLPKLQFEFWGTYQAAVSEPLPSVDYTAFEQPLGVNASNTSLTLHGTTVAASAFSFDMGLTVVKRDLINVNTVEITGRKSSGSVTFDNTLVSEKNWTELARTATSGALTLRHGTGGSNIVELNANKVQLGKPAFADSDGIQQITVPLRFIPTSGNDEWEIVVR